MELLAQGSTVASVLERLGEPRLPQAIVKYLFCSPNLDFTFRCMPAAGGLYDQRYRDVAEFAVIEARLRDIKRRQS